MNKLIEGIDFKKNENTNGITKKTLRADFERMLSEMDESEISSYVFIATGENKTNVVMDYHKYVEFLGSLEAVKQQALTLRLDERYE